MDLGDPASLISGLVLGLVGMGLLIYGKKQQEFVPLGGGVVLCVVPYFVASVWLMWAIAGACLFGVWRLARTGI